MKLYEVKSPCKIRIKEIDSVPPAHRELHQGEIVNFKHLDGMYSLCYTEQGEMIHPAAWTEVEIVVDN